MIIFYYLDLKRKFKPFANDIKSHLNERKQTILKEGRKGVIEELKVFSTVFKIPEFSGSDKGSPKSTAGFIIKEPEPSTSTPSASVKTSAASAKEAKSLKKHNAILEDTTSVVSEAGSVNISTSTSMPAKTFKLSAAAAEFTPSGYPPVVPNSQYFKKGGKRPYNKGNHMPGCMYFSILTTNFFHRFWK